MQTAVILPDDLLLEIDRVSPDRSAFLEQAARQYLAQTKARQSADDARILDENADFLNEEAADVLDYQRLPE